MMIKIIYKKIRSLITFILVTIGMLTIRFVLFLVKITNKNNKKVYEDLRQLVRDKLDDLPDLKYKAYCYDIANVL